jgi:hypothetical protein
MLAMKGGAVIPNHPRAHGRHSRNSLRTGVISAPGETVDIARPIKVQAALTPGMAIAAALVIGILAWCWILTQWGLW